MKKMIVILVLILSGCLDSEDEAGYRIDSEQLFGLWEIGEIYEDGVQQWHTNARMTFDDMMSFGGFIYGYKGSEDVEFSGTYYISKDKIYGDVTSTTNADIVPIGSIVYTAWTDGVNLTLSYYTALGTHVEINAIKL